MSKDLQFIYPSWAAPENIKAVTTTRTGGFSCGPYESFNLGDHVGDEPDAVERNRTLLHEALTLPSRPVWLAQVHGTNVVNAAQASAQTEADGGYAEKPGVVCAVLTADCLPVFLCDKAGTKVALLHAGWRGLAAGVIESGVKAMGVPGRQLLAWLGPGIGPDAYEVGEEVRRAFVERDAGAAEAFRPSSNGRWLVDMYALARHRLHRLGVTEVGGGNHCTYTEADKFFSYRRDGTCGRMASLIWMT